MNKVVYVRQVYTFLEWLADIGGLFGALGPICMIFVKICQLQASYQFVMAEMFVDRDGKPPTAPSPKEGAKDIGKVNVKTVARLKRKNDIQWNSFSSILVNLQTRIPHKWLCKCLRPKGRQQLVVQGYK